MDKGDHRQIILDTFIFMYQAIIQQKTGLKVPCTSGGRLTKLTSGAHPEQAGRKLKKIPPHQAP